MIQMDVVYCYDRRKKPRQRTADWYVPDQKGHDGRWRLVTLVRRYSGRDTGASLGNTGIRAASKDKHHLVVRFLETGLRKLASRTRVRATSVLLQCWDRALACRKQQLSRAAWLKHGPNMCYLTSCKWQGATNPGFRHDWCKAAFWETLGWTWREPRMGILRWWNREWRLNPTILMPGDEASAFQDEKGKHFRNIWFYVWQLIGPKKYSSVWKSLSISAHVNLFVIWVISMPWRRCPLVVSPRRSLLDLKLRQWASLFSLPSEIQSNLVIFMQTSMSTLTWDPFGRLTLPVEDRAPIIIAVLGHAFPHFRFRISSPVNRLWHKQHGRQGITARGVVVGSDHGKHGYQPVREEDSEP